MRGCCVSGRQRERRRLYISPAALRGAAHFRRAGQPSSTDTTYTHILRTDQPWSIRRSNPSAICKKLAARVDREQRIEAENYHLKLTANRGGMSRLWLLLLLSPLCLERALCQDSSAELGFADALDSASSRGPRDPPGLEYALKRGLLSELEAARQRRASGMGSSFIRYGRGGADLGAVSQPHTRSDIIIRYGRDGMNGRLTRLRQERMRRLARLALICAAKSQDDVPASSAEEKILRDICKDAPLHPTVPDFV